MKKSMKKILLCGLVTAIALSSSLTALAGTWKQDHIGWWWQEDNGSYPTSTWKEIDGKWYYFEPSGYMAENKWIGNYYVGSDGAMLVNTTTPDGYKVGADGAWIQESTIVQNNITYISDKNGWKVGDKIVLFEYIEVAYQGADIWMSQDGYYYTAIKDHGNGAIEFIQGKAARPDETPVSETLGYKPGDSIFYKTFVNNPATGKPNFNRIYLGNDRWYDDTDPNDILLATLQDGKLIFTSIN